MEGQHKVPTLVAWLVNMVDCKYIPALRRNVLNQFSGRYYPADQHRYRCENLKSQTTQDDFREMRSEDLMWRQLSTVSTLVLVIILNVRVHSCECYDSNV
jgi:hypothetical protein